MKVSHRVFKFITPFISALLCVLICSSPCFASVKSISISVTTTTSYSAKISISAKGASKFEVYRATGNGKYKKIKTLSSKTKTYTNTNLTFGKTYKYKVKAISKGSSKYSSGKSVTIGKPTLKSVKAKTNDITLSYNKISSVGGVEIYRSSSKSSGFSLIKRSTGTSFTDKNRPCGKRYYYKIRSYKTKSGKRKYTSFSSVKSAATAAHYYGSYIFTKNPTCTAKGTKTKYCKYCNHAYSVSVSSTGHSYTKSIVYPTCEKDGYTLYKCAKCSSSYKQNITSKTNHNYMLMKTVSPTCTKDGYSEYVCENCGKTKTDDIIISKGHQYTLTSSVSSPCSDIREDTYACSVCGAGYTVTSRVAPMHQFEEITVAPTCFFEGYTVRECSVCGKVDGDRYNIVPKMSHVDGGEVAVDGVIMHRCAICGTLY